MRLNSPLASPVRHFAGYPRYDSPNAARLPKLRRALNMRASSIWSPKAAANQCRGRRHSVPSSFHEYLASLFVARCQDLKIPYLPEQEQRFQQACQHKLKDRRFDMRDAGLGPSSAAIIGQILNETTDFAYVYLAKNSLGDRGSVELVHLLRQNRSVVHLDLSSNDLSPDGCKALLEVLVSHDSLTSLSLASREGCNRNRLGSLGATAVSKYLQNTSMLTHLNLAGTGLGPEGLQRLADGLATSCSLLALNLASNQLTEQVGAFVEALGRTRIADLNLAQNKLGSSGAECLAMSLRGITRLVKLDLSANQVGPKGAHLLFEALEANTTLQHLSLEGNNFSRGLSNAFYQCLRGSQTLKTLNVSGCRLAGQSMSLLGAGLRDNGVLLNLVLTHNSLQNADAAELAAGLARNRSLKSLNLSHNRIKVNFIQDEGVAVLCASLASHPAINKLVLTNNKVKADGGEALLQLVKRNTGLLLVKIDGTIASVQFAERIHKVCQTHEGVQTLRQIPIRKGTHKKLRRAVQDYKQVQSELNRQQSLHKCQSVKLTRQIRDFEAAKVVEAKKLRELTLTLGGLKAKHASLDNCLAELDLKQEVKARQTLTAQFAAKKQEVADRLTQATFLLKQAEKEKASCKQEYTLKRMGLQQVEAQLRDELEEAQRAHSQAQLAQ